MSQANHPSGSVNYVRVSRDILGICLGFVLLYLMFRGVWFLYIASVIGASLIIPPLARVLRLGWIVVTHAVGWVNTRILLAVIFIFVLTPVALLRKIMRQKVRRNSSKDNSHFIQRDHTYVAADMEKMW